MTKVIIFICFVFTFTANCSNSSRVPQEGEARPPVESPVETEAQSPDLPATPGYPAAYDLTRYIAYLKGKRVALVVNQTSTTADGSHLVDALLLNEVDVKTIFAPEHGFRGEADAGATVANGVDQQTGLPIISLYGKNKKPAQKQLADVDVVVFDIQDVGARFYTYISTLLYVMESAARYGKPLLVLDRPNPNGLLVDGPMLEPAFTSFVGVAPIPVAHGLTVGEFAQMANQEGWLPAGLRADLQIVPMTNYRHGQVYDLPVPPSPNLPNQRSIYLYPHLCFFEGTALSIGRGTLKQFQVYGHPKLSDGDYRFTPKPGPGSANPKLNGQECYGRDLSVIPTENFVGLEELNLDFLLSSYRDLNSQGITFFTRPDFFDLLAGTDQLRKDIEAGRSEAEIRAKWAQDLAKYRSLRERYLLYP